MTKTMPIIEACKKLTTLPEEFEREPETAAVAVTRKGKPVLALMPWELYESIMETLEIVGDEDLMSALRQGIKDIEGDRTYSMEEVKQGLGL